MTVLNWNKVDFEAAFGTLEQLFQSDLPEICFSGRSNVGKSSLINKILNRKSIARVSSTPGKTVTINFYKLDELRLVDLPGYGYAKVADSERERWAELMEGYFRTNRNIRLCLQLIDMRHPATDFDISMLEFLAHFEIPYAVVLTKCDKLNKSEFNKRLSSLKEELGDLGSNVKIIPFSALKGTGADDVRKAIEVAIGEN
ncbi:MAG: YihA family ribosome biogenesis GTP-binding protein [Clostridia bacterium]|nr:YihA family ribosome biogenesis GTP-binding protein [Clostridia bacterium]